MNQKEITIINKLGLHARAAAKFVKIASGFQAEINVYAGHKEVSGKSIMGIMMLAAGKGTTIEIKACGADEDAAMDALAALINDKFGEDE
ncbi:MAG TPA: HPr family phosphocarrier protein [Thiotrichaceae bacterium]|nr:HPr family phosphocarrier protein [Thiotrichaceae bacterium]HIM07597.1 HPr family phosphocarrier protein [Gammaproteobacteria bacterium]